ncbi:MAG: hypothetical protein V4489_00555 [Chlamydiota bacterium]
MRILILFFFPLTSSAASMTFSSNPSPLAITKAIPGKELFTVLDTSTTCNLTVLKKPITILAALDSPLQAHTTLKIGLSLPPQSASFTSLSTTPQVLASSISEGSYPSIQITYEYAATVAAGVIPMQTRTIFFTLIERE